MKNKLKSILAVLLALALSTSMVFAANVPADVAGTDCEKVVEELVEAGVITGDTDGLYHPEQNLTRAQVSVMIAKAIDPEIVGDEEAMAAGQAFPDMDGYGWAAGAIGLMTERDIAKGYPDGLFRPGANVTVAELVTFAVRAAGYPDESLESDVWPDNFMAKAKELEIYTEDLGNDPQKTPATKELAAIVICNALELIKAEAEKYEAEQMAEGFVYGDIKFDSNCSAVNGQPLASDVKIYPYELKKNYSEDMEVPDVSKLGTESVYKYKNVSTVGWCKVEKGEVIAVILPWDCGFTGTIYGVINNLNEVNVIYDGHVSEFDTLAAGKELSWFGDRIYDGEDSDIFRGMDSGFLFEMKASKGRITKVTPVIEEQAGSLNKIMTMMADTDQGSWEVTEKNTERSVLQIKNGDDQNIFAYKDTTLVYVYDEGEYSVGTMASVSKGDYVRAYDITDDKEEIADIIIVSEEEFKEGQ